MVQTRVRKPFLSQRTATVRAVRLTNRLSSQAVSTARTQFNAIQVSPPFPLLSPCLVFLFMRLQVPVTSLAERGTESNGSE